MRLTANGVPAVGTVPTGDELVASSMLLYVKRVSCHVSCVGGDVLAADADYLEALRLKNEKRKRL